MRLKIGRKYFYSGRDYKKFASAGVHKALWKEQNRHRIEGTADCRQILTARRLSISECRGTGAFDPIYRFMKIEWRPPSRARGQPLRREMIDQFVALHDFGTPASTESGISSG